MIVFFYLFLLISVLSDLLLDGHVADFEFFHANGLGGGRGCRSGLGRERCGKTGSREGREQGVKFVFNHGLVCA